jgi:hypothetical protein
MGKDWNFTGASGARPSTHKRKFKASLKGDAKEVDLTENKTGWIAPDRKKFPWPDGGVNLK